jgi:hypothetical protein
VLQQTSSDPKQVSGENLQTFVLEIIGTNLNTTGLQVVVFPANDIKRLAVLPASAAEAPTTMRVRFTAPQSYLPEEVAVLPPGLAPVVHRTGTTSCDFANKVDATFQVVPQRQSKTKYGNGVAANFHVIQISIVNGCTQSVVVPLAGVKLTPITAPSSTTQGGTSTTQSSAGSTPSTLQGSLVPFSLDHVTSIYNTDRKLTGARAIFFNSLQAAATLGSAIEPFFGSGFTKGVSIWGGGFTQSAQTILKDMSAEQLQNLTSQSFESTEQVGPNGGSLQKFIFIRKLKKKEQGLECDADAKQKMKKGKEEKPLECGPRTVTTDAILTGNFNLTLNIVPVSSQAATSAVKANQAK